MRIMFIPKKPNTITPVHLRPISIASTLKLSGFHFGFRPVDGVARGIDLLDSAVRSVQVYFKLISMAVFDLEKIFDSVSH